ncbi:peptidoglycan D,D-transpeptidase FtsI family protein [Nocardioides sp.]|uniref:peptidoglycan D,D-transpeptidase FtsI family protein n=1 Tax=Nocardioides sp. TaxID=35761 RepID=UPI003D0A73CF
MRSYRGGARGSSMFRLRFGFVVIAMVVSVFGARLIQLQGLDPHAYAAAAAQEGLVEAVLPARRGSINDRNGEPLANSIDGLMIVADPVQTDEHAAEIAKILANRLGIDYLDAKKALTRKLLPGTSDQYYRFAYVARRVPSTLAADVLAELRAAGYKGIDTRIDPVRDYPAHDVAANLVGFMDAFNTPLAGFEQAFDKQLSGVDGSERYEVGGGNRIPLGLNDRVAPVNGSDLNTTLDRDTQWYVQRVLAQAIREARADSGSAVVLDTRTGETLALADYPTYDADEPGDSSAKDRGTPSLSNPYEPGSVEKTLTMAALLDQRLVTPLTKISVPSDLDVMGETIHDHFEHGVLDLTLTGVLAKSSNIGTVLATQKISASLLHRYLVSFGLGQTSNIGVPNESRGMLPDASTWTPLTRATVAFGQGLAVNAVQMAGAINTIANDGVYVSPSLIQGSATNAAGETVGTDTSVTRRVVSPRAAQQVARMMERVLDPVDGVAPDAAIPGYRVAGKTGTAQVVGKKCKCYLDNVFNVSFGGFAPADNPRFTVYIVVRHPRNGGGGGAVAGPVFQKIMSHLLRSYGIPPTGSAPSSLPICADHKASDC